MTVPQEGALMTDSTQGPTWPDMVAQEARAGDGEARLVEDDFRRIAPVVDHVTGPY